MYASFNPKDNEPRVYVQTRFVKAKEVHAYDAETGLYIKSYPSSGIATKELTGKSSSSHINSVCTGKIKKEGGVRKVAYGFRWSFEKIKRIKL